MNTVLARKHRPEDFEQVVGQELTIKQIKSAVEKGTLGHSLLFTGTRGTGKTTTARIIAQVLNPDLSPGELKMAVTEMDAASNTGVEDVRQIIDTVRFAVHGHRVVILDEAHMLSRNAFNALLKTLEEPPPGVTFILVTTEPQKLPATVRSRCQIYEFRDVSLEELVAHYSRIAKAEGLTLTEVQLQEVALKAEGSVRDGLSLLQKYLSGEEIVNNSNRYFNLVGALYAGDPSTALAIVGDLRKDEEARIIIQTLEKWFYWLSLECFGKKTSVRDFFDPGAFELFDLNKLQKLFSLCLQIERDFTATPNSKIVLEMGIIRLAGDV